MLRMYIPFGHTVHTTHGRPHQTRREHVYGMYERTCGHRPRHRQRPMFNNDFGLVPSQLWLLFILLHGASRRRERVREHALAHVQSYAALHEMVIRWWLLAVASA